MSTPALRRRDFVTLLGSGIALPLTARVRDAAKLPTIGVLWHAGSPDVFAGSLRARRLSFRGDGHDEIATIEISDQTRRFGAVVAVDHASFVGTPASERTRGCEGRYAQTATFSLAELSATSRAGRWEAKRGQRSSSLALVPRR
jgi:hypothetical protein